MQKGCPIYKPSPISQELDNSTLYKKRVIDNNALKTIINGIGNFRLR